MYCPRCGQQQISDETRFCSRCGLQLDAVRGLLAGNPETIARPMPQGERTPRSRGMRRGAKLLFLSVVIVPVFIALAIIFDSPGPLVVPFTIFLTGLAMLLYSRLFGEDILPAKSQPQQPAQLGTYMPPTALPPSPGVPFTGYSAPRPNTEEIAQPPSVTDGTTKLLDKSE